MTLANDEDIVNQISWMKQFTHSWKTKIMQRMNDLLFKKIMGI